MSTNKQFIGKFKVKAVIPQEDGFLRVHFKDEYQSDLVIHPDLFQMIVREVENAGDTVDAIRHALSTKFLMELATYKQPYYMIESITNGMRVLAHNSRETAISKAFDVAGSDDIALDKLVDSF